MLYSTIIFTTLISSLFPYNISVPFPTDTITVKFVALYKPDVNVSYPRLVYSTLTGNFLCTVIDNQNIFPLSFTHKFESKKVIQQRIIFGIYDTPSTPSTNLEGYKFILGLEFT